MLGEKKTTWDNREKETMDLVLDIMESFLFTLLKA